MKESSEMSRNESPVKSRCLHLVRMLLVVSVLVLAAPTEVTAQAPAPDSSDPEVSETTSNDRNETSTPEGTRSGDSDSAPASTIQLLDLLISLLIVAVALVAAYLVHRVFGWLGEVARKSRYNIDGLVIKILGPPISVLVATFPILYALRRVPAIHERLRTWPGLETALLILVGTWLLASFVKKLINHYGIPFARRTETTVDERLIHILDLTAVYVIWILGILVALRTVGVKVTAFLASMGIVGLAVALAARTVLSNMLGGITLTADPYLNLGDRIEVNDWVGDVVDINLYKTTIKTRDNKIVSIPNDVLVKEIVINHELPEARTRLSLPFGVSYDSDPEEVTQIVYDILDEEDRVEDEPEPEVNMEGFGDNALEFQILVWLDSPRGRRTVRNRVYRRIFHRFNEENIEIPYPQRVVHQP